MIFFSFLHERKNVHLILTDEKGGRKRIDSKKGDSEKNGENGRSELDDAPPLN